MAIDPKLVSIKQASDLPSAIPTNAGEFLFFEDNTLQKSPMSDIYDRLESGIKGVATTSTVPSATGFERWLVHEAGTYTNFNGIVVTSADLDIVGGVANNRVILEVSEGVATKRVERVKGDPGSAVSPVFNPTTPTEPQGGKQIYDYLYGSDSEIRGLDITTALNSELVPYNIYYYKSAKINEGESIENINFQLHTAGTIDLILLDLNNNVLHTEEKTGLVGNNTFSFSGISAIPKPYFPALKPKTSKLTTNFPADGDISDGVYIEPSSVVFESGYTIPYNVTVSFPNTESIGGKLSTIQILTKSVTSEIQTQINNTGKINPLKREYLIEDTLIIPDGTHIDGCFGGSVFKHSGFSGELFDITDRENVKIENIVIEGTKPNYAYSMNGIDSGANIIANLAEGVAGTYKTDQHGFNILRSENLVLDSLIIRNLGGNAIAVNRTGRDYIKGMKSSKIWITDCHTGLYGINEHEFSSYSEMTISLCQIGQYLDSGNLMTLNSYFTRCRFGIIVDGGFNHAHGTTGMNSIKHHQLAGIAFNNVSAGQYVPDIHMDYAKILINNSNGVEVNGRMGSNCSFESIGNPAGKPNVVNVSTMTNVNNDTVGTSNSTLNVTS